ncbi:MAG TPA: sulfotransferase [Candidatus Limnocylindria bacterium]|nr:sulfotransferase [Candidatus Limnocylindria bacterium]
MRPNEPEAIFVVGVSRSGTTLLRTVLETSERIAIAPENHFVGHLVRGYGAREQFRRLGDLAEDGTISRVVEFVYSGEMQRRSRLREISPFWRWLIREITPADVEQRLLAAERTERGVWAALLRIYADFHGRPVMGEITPAHLAFVDTLLQWFPGAKVVHIVRDPRAVYVSDSRRRRDRPTPPYSWLMRVPLAFQAVMLVQTVLAWSGAARRHWRLLRGHSGSYSMIRFEDLVGRPDEVLPALFDFLGVALPATVTDVKVVSRGFNLGEAGFDAGAADRWREHIHPFAARFLRLVLGRSMRRLGYLD